MLSSAIWPNEWLDDDEEWRRGWMAASNDIADWNHNQINSNHPDNIHSQIVFHSKTWIFPPVYCFVQDTSGNTRWHIHTYIIARLISATFQLYTHYHTTIHDTTLCPQKTCDYIFYNNFNNKCPITIITIERVAERCLFTKQYVAYGEICHFCVLWFPNVR